MIDWISLMVGRVTIRQPVELDDEFAAGVLGKESSFVYGGVVFFVGDGVIQYIASDIRQPLPEVVSNLGVVGVYITTLSHGIPSDSDVASGWYKARDVPGLLLCVNHDGTHPSIAPSVFAVGDNYEVTVEFIRDVLERKQVSRYTFAPFE